MTDQAAGDGAPVIVVLPEEIDVANVGKLHELLNPAILSGARVVVADLSATEFCDAAGVRQLVKIRHEAAACGVRLRLAIPPGRLLRRTLVIMRADRLLPVYSTTQEAARLIAAPQDSPSITKPRSGGQPESTW